MPVSFDDLIPSNSPAPAVTFDDLIPQGGQPENTDTSLPALGGMLPKGIQEGILDTAKGLVGGVKQLPGMAYQGAKFAAGGSQEKLQVAAEALKEAIPMGEQIAKDVQSPVGSREWTRGVLQMGMMATPAAELFGELRSPSEIESPPIQTEAPPVQIAPEDVAAREQRAATIQQYGGISPETGEPLTFDDLIPQAEKSPGESSTQAGQTSGIPESPEAATPGDIATGQQPPIQTIPSDLGQPEPDGEIPGSGLPAGTSNRIFTQTYGEDVVPGGRGADTTQLLDNARTAIRAGTLDPYSVLSQTRQRGIATPDEYAVLAAEHERLANEAVAKQKAGDPTAPEAGRQSEDFANAIQPFKTGASDLMRLFQGELNYDLSTPFGMDQYMKAELGRGMKVSERPKFNRMANDINQAENEVPQAVARSDVRVQRCYGNVRDIPIEEAVKRVKEQLGDCLV